ncbi:NAD-binding protein [Pseudarthrobacter enclensis]|uniref:3-hydroxyisobutyrate dehydrogenase-like beta-hydroxyacid dehydrogenase n=1 Tax=Pseudarthrobacter enclensis TaxID=993070 RepID=A0ABT9RSW4_9MICC|nr:NAD-binding protein [Pseudarthrobacter enclensis]MDP9888332.1 3-hydroxyisobutyrate dehydrogenase-like beta-hydroxyacid dehydrogenase [Pseudarthrobacter enclensis]
MLAQKGQRFFDQDFDGGGSAKNQLKDLNFIAEAAGNSGLKLPVAACLQKAFEKMVAAGDGGLDHTGIYRTIRG